MPVAQGAERRRHSRLAVRLPLRWSVAIPGEATAPGDHVTETVDMSAGGLALWHEQALPVGTYLELEVIPPDMPQLRGIQGIVTGATELAREGGYLIGVRFVACPQDALHSLLLAAYEKHGEFRCICTDVRHCGELRLNCAAFLADRNCWQVPDVPCCHWRAQKDCETCPVSMLVFLA